MNNGNGNNGNGKHQGISLEVAAKQMAAMLDEHFASLPKAVREKKIKAFEAVAEEVCLNTRRPPQKSRASSIKGTRRTQASRA